VKGGCFIPWLTFSAVNQLRRVSKALFQTVAKPYIWQTLLSKYFSDTLQSPAIDDFRANPQLLFRARLAEQKCAKAKEEVVRTVALYSRNEWGGH
jgi:hypothetical protein